MADIAIVNYQRSVEKAVARAAAKVEKVRKDLDPIDEELEELAKSKDPDDKKKAAELEKKRAALIKKLDTIALELKTDMMLVTPPSSAPEKELLELPGWMKEIIKAKGFPLGKGVSVVPEVEFDMKSKTLKYVGVKFRF